jgi:hypothetical protein
MRLLSIALTAFSFPILGHAAIAGDWRGSVNLSGKPGRFVLHIAGTANALTATFDSPEAAIIGGKVDAITLSGPTLNFAIQFPDVSFLRRFERQRNDSRHFGPTRRGFAYGSHTSHRSAGPASGPQPLIVP